MKKKGSTSDFTAARDIELYQAFREELGSGKWNSLRDIFAAAAKKPCSRIWVSEARAAQKCYCIRKNGLERELAGSPEKKREMYCEIWRRVCNRMEMEPEMSMAEAAADAVCMPAPEFYLTEKSAMVIIYRIARRRRLAAMLDRKREGKGGSK